MKDSLSDSAGIVYQVLQSPCFAAKSIESRNSLLRALSGQPTGAAL
jgi:hypothetical protein